MTTERSGIPRSRRDAPGLYDPPDAGFEALEPPTLRARLVRIAVFMLVPALLLVLLAGIALYVRMLQGPISLNALKESIEEGLAAELPEYKTSIDDAMLALNGARIEVRLVNLRIADAANTPLASAPLAAVQISKSSLLTFRFAPQRVFLIEPKLSLVYSEQTGFALSLGDKAQSEGGAAKAAPPLVPPEPQPAQRPNVTDVTKADAQQASAPQVLPPSFHRFDLARALAEATRQARSGKAVSSRLKEVGVRDATLEVLYAGRTTTLSIPQAGVSVDHSAKGTTLQGQVNVVSEKGPWDLVFTTEDSENGDFIRVESSVKNLVPSTLARIAPQLALFEPLDLPVSGTLTANLTSEGDLKSSGLILEFQPGSFRLPSFSTAPLLVDKGEIKLDYDAEAHQLRIAPSQFVFGDSHVTLEGEMMSSTEPGDRVWSFAIKSTEGSIASGEFSVQPVAIEGLQIAGRITPQAGALELTTAVLKVGGTDITASGQFISSPERSGTRLEAAMTPMTLSTLKALWPRAASPGARNWVGTNMTKGAIRSASLKIVSGVFNQENGDAGNERLSLAIETQDLEMYPSGEGLPLVAPRALLRLENSALEVSAPEAQIIAGQKQIAIKGTRFTVVDFTGAAPSGELVFKVQSPLSGVLEAVNRAKLPQLPNALPADLVDGKVEGDFKVSMILADGPNPRPKIEGKGRISDIRSPKNGKKIEVQGGTIDIALSDAGVNATGDVLVNGTLAKLQLQRIFDAPDDIQPPLRITATLDNADRTQLGLDINHMIQGELAVEVTVIPGANGAPPQIHLRGDLTNSELLLPDVAWRKVPGRPAALDVDISAGTGDVALELKNFRIVGDDIALEGNLTVDAENEVREFDFPTFSLNIVSRMSVSGKISSDKIWKITAKGSTFDAKDFFRSIVSLGKTSEQEIKPLRPSNGFDFQGEIDTALGHSDINIRNLKIRLSNRKDRLVSLSAQGLLEDGKVINASMKPETGRKIFADSNDAGQAFKVIGFYPNLQGGRLKLEVDLDGRGAAEKSGVLWVESFRILGDTVLSDIYASAETSGPEIEKAGGSKRVVREVFDFDRMRVPFSVGHGQFVLDESHLRGPAMGMSIRGKVDYTTERLNLGGTYVPLQGINSAFCQIPLVGPLVSGLDCQGVFGITYAIQGPMARPQVIVNPLSMFTPGILRGIMEMTNPNPEVLPRSEKQMAPVEQRVRNSASEANSPTGKLPSVSKPSETVDGWTSETITTTAPKGQQTQKKPAQASTTPVPPKAAKPPVQKKPAAAASQKTTNTQPQSATPPKAQPAKKPAAPTVANPVQ